MLHLHGQHLPSLATATLGFGMTLGPSSQSLLTKLQSHILQAQLAFYMQLSYICIKMSEQTPLIKWNRPLYLIVLINVHYIASDFRVTTKSSIKTLTSASRAPLLCRSHQKIPIFTFLLLEPYVSQIWTYSPFIRLGLVRGRVAFVLYSVIVVALSRN